MKNRPFVPGDNIETRPFNDLMAYVHETNIDLREGADAGALSGHMMWAEIIGKVNVTGSSDHPRYGYLWREVVPDYQRTKANNPQDEKPTWTPTGLDHTYYDYAFEANNRPILIPTLTDPPTAPNRVYRMFISLSNKGTSCVFNGIEPPFWARLIAHGAGSYEHGYTWKEVVPQLPVGSSDIVWLDGVLTSEICGYAYEVNDIAVALKQESICAGEGGNIVYIVPSKSCKSGRTLDDNTIAYMFNHSEANVDFMAPLSSAVPGSGSTLDTKMWDKFKGYSTDAGTLWSKYSGVTPYDGFQMYMVTRTYLVGEHQQPIFRLFKWDAQGHLVNIGVEETPP